MKTRLTCLCLLVLLLPLAACGEVPTATPLPGQGTLPLPTVDSYPMPQVTWTPDPYPRVIPTDVPWTPHHPAPPPNVPVLGAEWAPLEERETYISTTVVVAPVGDGPGEIGYQSGGEGNGYLPIFAEHFTVDDGGNIYILDKVNRRVVEFDSGGVFVTNIPYGDAVQFAHDLAVDTAGQVYVYDPDSRPEPVVKLFDRQGNLLRQYPIPTWFWSELPPSKMRVDREGILWVEAHGSYPNAPIIDGQPYPVVTVPVGNAEEVFDEEYQKAMAIPGHMLDGGATAIAHYSSSAGGHAYLYNLQGEPIYELIGSGPIAIDSQGFWYLVGRDPIEAGMAARLYKLNGAGQEVASFDLPVNPGLVDETGAVYCLVWDRQTETGYRVIRWQRQ